MTDPVNHPPHYQAGNGVEVIDVIEGFRLCFHLGNVVKYVLRAGNKVKIETHVGAEFADIQRARAELKDYQKGRWYLDRRIKQAEKKITFLIDLYGPAKPQVSESNKHPGLPLSIEYVAVLKQLQNAHCDVQFAMATALAANSGYVLTSEPTVER